MGRTFCLILVCLFGRSALASEDDFFASFLRQDESFHRRLQNRPCGTSFGIITSEEVRAAGEIAISNLVDSGLVNSAVNVAFRNAIFDIEAVKICTSCSDLFLYYIPFNRSWPTLHFDYCGESAYGNDVTQSSLVFIPQGLVRTKIRAFISLLGSPGNRNLGPSDRFPSDFPSLLANVQAGTSSTDAFRSLLSDMLPAMQAASSGTVSIVPDYIGYGESKSSNRATFFSPMYQQSATIHWLAMESYLNTTTQGCMLLNSDAVTVHCVEDGTFGCAGAVGAFQRLDARSLQIFMGPGPLDLQTFLKDSFEKLNSGGLPAGGLHEQLLASTAFAYSVDTPGIPNSGSGETMAAATSRITLQQIFGPNPPASLPTLPSNLLSILNLSLQSRLSVSSSLSIDPCPHPSIPDLCMAIQNASAWINLLGRYSVGWNYETVMCNSPENEIFSAAHLPQEVLDVEEVRVYEGAFGLETELLPRGNHQLAKEYCNMDSFVFFTLENDLHRPTNQEDWAQYRIPLEPAELALCQLTAAPSTAADVAPAVRSPSGPGVPTPTNPTSPTGPTPTGPTPTSPTSPTGPTPTNPTPSGPTPTSPTPSGPTPTSPTPTDPTDGNPTPTGGSPSPGDPTGGGGDPTGGSSAFSTWWSGSLVSSMLACLIVIGF